MNELVQALRLITPADTAPPDRDPRLLASFPPNKHRHHSPSASSSSQQIPFGPSAVEDRGIVGEQISASAGSRCRSPMPSESGRSSQDTQVPVGEDTKLTWDYYEIETRNNPALPRCICNNGHRHRAWAYGVTTTCHCQALQEMITAKTPRSQACGRRN
ncbi:hypothetical protein ASPVEDRAFT_296370 [Aspergillus versicolor CBS 583.65]|uniref:Uncharacterized protein n=1 Tax=Aspergillus versicolor CBS 583.65 TaxID=1036611 RepID=A0A1L9P7K4_ASPVE|nr:uncharacterized protein ASPVEDRAFT_296370 [Aspergillus versicolor CBS 583.65]OJI97507.1 hypothetical protein ASPVEDRAFT_296370 [Aspergillus versicolor CBS 583.65]